MTKCVVIPAIAASMLPDTPITLTFKKLTWNEFTELLTKCERIVNYNRHKPTNDLLMTIIPKFETGFEYKVDINDLIIVLGLKTRTPTSGVEVTVTPNDLLIYLVKPAQ